jgi:NADPH:quinone reductase-like Zn-dependent oxidoreductase
VVRSAFPAGVDGLIDAALISAEVSSLVRDGGAAVSVRKSHPIEDPRLRAGSVMVTTAMQDKDALRFMADLIERGELTPRVARVYDFQQAAEAFQQSASSGLRGRIVLRFAH